MSCSTEQKLSHWWATPILLFRLPILKIIYTHFGNRKIGNMVGPRLRLRISCHSQWTEKENKKSEILRFKRLHNIDGIYIYWHHEFCKNGLLNRNLCMLVSSLDTRYGNENAFHSNLVCPSNISSATFFFLHYLTFLFRNSKKQLKWTII